MSATPFFAMLVWHAIADYPLQGEFLARAKNPATQTTEIPWWQALGAHAVIHAGGVAFITGSLWLGLAEFVSHALIDDSKCRGRIGYNTDQALHVACKAVWALFI
ncbi:MAG: DUF3307 domain-containing protein [Thermomonas sp.]